MASNPRTNDPAPPAPPASDAAPAPDGPDDPRDARIAALEAALAQLREEKTTLVAQLAATREQIRIRPLAPGAKVGVPLAIAKVRIRFGADVIEPGAPMPFDVGDPPAGCAGLELGVHYELR